MESSRLVKTPPVSPSPDDWGITRRSVQRHLKNFYRPCVMVTLRTWPIHGYGLAEKLRMFGFTNEPSRVYVELRALEREGLIWSRGQKAAPERRVYRLTAKGDSWLNQWAGSLAATARVLSLFGEVYHQVMSRDEAPLKASLNLALREVSRHT